MASLGSVELHGDRMTLATRARALQHLKMAQADANVAAGACRVGIVGEGRLPIFMLIAHALELSLKAIASVGGRNEERLMMIGHNMRLCHDLARQGGLYQGDGGADVEALVEALAEPHAFQAFRYPQPLHWALPEPLEAMAVLGRHLIVTAQLLGS